MLAYPEPDWLAGVWAYGPETVEDSDSDLTPRCDCCEGAIDQHGWCADCAMHSPVPALPMRKAA